MRVSLLTNARFRRMLRSERGNVLMTFALATIPLIGFVGAAVDYSRGNLVRTAMQAALDSTALMLSRDAQKLTTDQMSQKANEYFHALFTRTDVTNLLITPALSVEATAASG